jgi:hypothetical protein
MKIFQKKIRSIFNKLKIQIVRKFVYFINKMDKSKFGFFNPATQTFMVIENVEEFNKLMSEVMRRQR